MEDFREMLAQALRESHLLHPGAVADLAQQAGQAIGVRDRGGQTFGDERLIQAVEDASLAGHGPAETVRRVAKAVLGHHAHGLTDEFTLVMVEYRAGEASPVPDAVRIVERRTLSAHLLAAP